MGHVGFIGLGIMGCPMAKNLLGVAKRLLVFDIDPIAVARLVAAGGEEAALSRIAEECGVVFLMLPSGLVVESVLFGEEGIARKLRPGTIVCDMSTTKLAEARSFANRLHNCGVDFLDAPVSGGEAKAVTGKLSIMAGGEERCFSAVNGYLRAMGGTVNRVGAHGSGCAAKLVNQILVHVTMSAVCEAYTLAEKLGVDIESVYNAVGEGSASSAMLHNRTAKILNRDFSPGAKISIVHKDIENVLAAARDADMPLPLTATVFDLLKAAKAASFHDDDVTRLLTVYERLGGIERKTGTVSG